MNPKKRRKKVWGKQLELFRQQPSVRPLAGEADLARTNHTEEVELLAPAGEATGSQNQKGEGEENPYEYGALLDYIEWNERHHKLN